jgi:hypothetical protein
MYVASGICCRGKFSSFIGPEGGNTLTYLGVCVTYRRVLGWWRDLLYSYTTCYYTSQTHYIFSINFDYRLKRLSQFSINCSLGTPELDWLFSTELFFITILHGPNQKHRLLAHLRGNPFIEPLPINQLFLHCQLRPGLDTSPQLSRLMSVEPKSYIYTDTDTFLTSGLKMDITCSSETSETLSTSKLFKDSTAESKITTVKS